MIFRLLRWTGYVFGGLLLLLILFAAERYVTLGRSLPQLEGTLAVDGAEAPVEVVRDRHAIPHVFAGTLEDAMLALGVVHAQDRLWQMAFLRRLGQGRLAEVVGSSALPIDVSVRSLDLQGLARASLAALSPRAQAALEAYARGVNSQIRDRDRPLPPEFFMLQTRPDPWAAEHSLLLLTMLGLGLSTNAATELARLDLATILPPDRMAELMAPFPGLPEGFDLELFQQPGEAELPDSMGASNSWAVDARRSVSGGALLANDPHLGLSMPGLWYLARLSFGERTAMGASIPGIPAILLGRTQDVSWGFTNTGTDVQDLVLERLSENGTSYDTPDGPMPLKSRTETFEVRFSDPVTRSLTATRNGPLIPLLEEAAPPGHAYAFKWTGLTGTNRTYESSLEILDARTIDQALAAVDTYVVPTQSMLFADRAGDIGFVAAGAVPVRGPDQIGQGLVPVAGWMSGPLWPTELPPRDWPRIWRPEGGVLVTANNDIRPPDYPHLITMEWRARYRAERIRRLLARAPRHSLDSFEAIQLDAQTGLKDELLEPMLTLTPPDRYDLAEALERLRAWDGTMAADAPEPLLFAGWLETFRRAVLEDDLGEGFARHGGRRAVLLGAVLRDQDGMGQWCDRVTTPDVVETCPALLAESFSTAFRELKLEHGEDWTAWRWGEAHHALHRHIPTGFLPVGGDLLSRSLPTPGGTYTVNRGAYAGRGAQRFANVHAGGYRALYDMARPEQSRYIISTGQSGNPYSPYYDNLMADWAEGRYITMRTERSAIEDGSIGTLTLVPAAQSAATEL